jgi:putative NADH-flavin reductase
MWRHILFWSLLATCLVPFTVAGAQPLDILVYGATGKIGSLVVGEALARGHHVTAVSRNPAQIELTHENLSVLQGDLLDGDSIRGLAAGQDILIVSVRGIIGDSKTAESALQFIAANRIVAALRAMEGPVPRVLHVGGAGSLEVEPGVLYADKLPRFFLPKKLELEIDGQVQTLDFYRSMADISWTYATPPKNFTNGGRTGRYRIGGDAMLEDRRGRSRISRADFAVALIDEAESGAHIRQRFSVAY